MTQVVERHLEALTSHDWDALRSCLQDDVVRVGPYNDEYRDATRRGALDLAQRRSVGGGEGEWVGAR